MPSQILSSVENNFTKGLITEFTGLNFPENAATDTDNCIYSIVGDVTRREGFDFETNHAIRVGGRGSNSMNTYKWNNVGGDGLTQIVVTQVGGALYFYRSSTATVANPLSTQILVSVINITPYVAPGGIFDPTLECQFSDGNGYLFVYHHSCNPIYCTYNAGVITPNIISLQIRDFTGVVDGYPINFRPTNLTAAHQYNLTNQGWVSGNPWSASSATTETVGTGSQVYSVAASIPGVTNGQTVTVIYQGGGNLDPGAGGVGAAGTGAMSGTVTAYSGTNLTLNITSVNSSYAGGTGTSWTVVPSGTGYLSTWNTAAGNYPSNADVWWYFKNASGVFDPATTISNVTLAAGTAPRGHYIIDAFNQTRTVTSGIVGITPVSTGARPKTGTWFQGRVWYTGVDAQQPATGTANYYTWTENIYFSQIVQDPSQFGNCYQTNDPTSENLFGLLPTDGGVITIQGCGSIYKLFPLQNALIVFAANGVWYITGSQGIGFTANDYTIVKMSSVRSISSTSFVDVQGLPMFWNEEGIYSVEPAKQGTSLLNSPLHVNPLEVVPITVGTILSFYANIPLQSKKYVRGDYNPIDYVVQWVFRSTNETDVTSRYQFDTILNYNNYNKAFFPYTLPSLTNPYVHGINYVAGPGGSNSPSAVFKYFTSTLFASNSYNFTFSEETNTNFVDWTSYNGVGINFTSFFITGYKLHGQGQRRFQVPYIYMYSRADDPTSYKIQGIWDYATTGNSGRWSTLQQTNNLNPNFGVIARRHKIRGQGLVLQIKVESTDNMPFDIIGWSTFETQNTGV